MNKIMIRYCVAGFLLFFFSHSGFALNAQREAFKVADKALRLANPALLNTLLPSLENYPLYPYLIHTYLSTHLDEVSAGSVHNFLQTYKDSPLAGRLLSDWIEQLAKQQRWQELLRDYQEYAENHQHTASECYYRQALLQTGQVSQALTQMESLWLVGHSQPDACDPIFQRWRDNGGITQALIWQRFVLAMEEGQTGLGRYLNRQMAEPNKATAQLWLDVHERPQRVLESQRFDAGNAYTSTILLHGVWQWSRKDSVSAARALDQLKQRYRFEATEKFYNLERRLAVLIAKRNDPSAAARLSALPPAAVDQEAAEWRVRTALRRQNWRLVLQWLEQMPPAGQNEPDWRYWRARALEAGGQTGPAQAIYQELSQLRDYYGFLAANRIGSKYNIQHQPIAVADPTLESVANLPGLQRARELYILERLSDARREWQHASRDFDPSQLTAAAKLAQSWNWHAQAIATLARADIWNDLQLRFPMPYQATIEQYAKAQNIDPAWVYAVMRQESLFQPDARSSAGAMGLMQIMPGTGRKIASDLKLNLPNTSALFNANTNIRYGTYYLRFTLNQLQGNPVLATAAYNAGPGRVRRWLPDQVSDPDIWVELIPFDETRKYVKRVMEYAAVYEWKLGRTQSSMQQRMPRILPGA